MTGGGKYKFNSYLGRVLELLCTGGHGSTPLLASLMQPPPLQSPTEAARGRMRTIQSLQV